MKKLIVSIATFLPAIAFAQSNNITDANTLVSKFSNLGNTFIGVLIAFAVLWIIYNVVRFIVKSDAPEERKEIGKAILWSIVGLFVILSIWGLVGILLNTFRTENVAPTRDFPVVPPILRN